jgi:hypothetical protein
MPLYPLGVTLGTLLLYLNFKFEMLKLTTFTAKSNQVPAPKLVVCVSCVCLASSRDLPFVCVLFYIRHAFPCFH